MQSRPGAQNTTVGGFFQILPTQGDHQYSLARWRMRLRLHETSRAASYIIESHANNFTQCGEAGVGDRE